jgi:hypothetical protein
MGVRQTLLKTKFAYLDEIQNLIEFTNHVFETKIVVDVEEILPHVVFAQARIVLDYQVPLWPRTHHL